MVNGVFSVLIGCRAVQGVQNGRVDFFLWNRISVGCDTVAMLGVEVVVCCGFRVLVWLFWGKCIVAVVLC